MKYSQNNVWFLPLNFVYHFGKLEQTKKIPKEKFKKCYEAYIAAIFLINMFTYCNKVFWMQIVPDKEGSPDIKSVSYKDNISNDIEIHDIELVFFEEHSHEDLGDFLLKTKLSKKKSYDNKTSILCYIQKNNYQIKKEIFSQLEKANHSFKGQLFLLWRNKTKNTQYCVLKVFPKKGVLKTFNVYEEVKKEAQYPSVLVLKKGLKRENNYVGEKFYPFDSILKK